MRASSSISRGPELTLAPASAERFTLDVGGVPVVGVLHHPAAGADREPCVVACHGLGASKDSDKYLLLARELTAAGLALARFDFRGSGESGGSYRQATVATRLADLQAVIEHLLRHPRLSGHMGLLGSSMGGFVAFTLAATGLPSLPVVAWSAPAHLHELRGAGVSEATGLGPALLAEIEAGTHAEAPSGARRALIVHGEADEVVPVEHARRLLDRAGEPKALHLIPGADHRLSDPVHRLRAVEVSRAWLVRHLIGAPA